MTNETVSDENVFVKDGFTQVKTDGKLSSTAPTKGARNGVAQKAQSPPGVGMPPELQTANEHIGTVKKRIAALASEKNLSLSDVSVKAGMSRTWLAGFLRNEHQRFKNYATLERTARALGVGIPDLLVVVNSDDPQRQHVVISEMKTAKVKTAKVHSTSAKSNVAESRSDIVIKRVPVVGIAEAGAFRPVEWFDDQALGEVVIAMDARLATLPHQALLIRGDSMDKEGIADGDHAVYVPISGIDLSDGDIVVVECATKSEKGDVTRELSVKLFFVHESTYEFRPNSSNPKHTSLLVSRDTDIFADDTYGAGGCRVMGYVYQTIKTRPIRWNAMRANLGKSAAIITAAIGSMAHAWLAPLTTSPVGQAATIAWLCLTEDFGFDLTSGLGFGI